MIRRGSDVQGYVFGRRGHNRDHLGPLVADCPDTAAALLDSILAEQPDRRFYLDVPDDQTGVARRHLEDRFRDRAAVSADAPGPAHGARAASRRLCDRRAGVRLTRVLTASTFARRLLRRLTATLSRRRMDALGRSIHVRGKGCAHDHDRFAHRDPSSSFSLVRTQARERGSACPARPIRDAAFRLNLEQQTQARKGPAPRGPRGRCGSAPASRRRCCSPGARYGDDQAHRRTVRHRRVSSGSGRGVTSEPM